MLDTPIRQNIQTSMSIIERKSPYNTIGTIPTALEVILTTFKTEKYPLPRLRQKTRKKDISLRRAVCVYCMYNYAEMPPREIKKYFLMTSENIFFCRYRVENILNCPYRGCDWLIVYKLITSISTTLKKYGYAIK